MCTVYPHYVDNCYTALMQQDTLHIVYVVASQLVCK